MTTKQNTPWLVTFTANTLRDAPASQVANTLAATYRKASPKDVAALLGFVKAATFLGRDSLGSIHLAALLASQGRCLMARKELLVTIAALTGYRLDSLRQRAA